MPVRSRYFALIGFASILVPVAAWSMPITIATLNGSWQLRLACMNDHGKPGACIEMKPGSLKFTFSADGTWSSAANDTNGTKKAGTYEIHGSRLVLKNADGALYQNWQTDVGGNGKSLLVSDKQLIETFERIN